MYTGACMIEISSDHLLPTLEAEQLAEVDLLWEQYGWPSLTPELAIILPIDENGKPEEASARYVKKKLAYASDIGVLAVEYPTPEHEIEHQIEELSQDVRVSSIMLQSPLPSKDREHTNYLRAQIPSDMDVDGLGPNAWYKSPTALAMMYILEKSKIPILGDVVQFGAYSDLANKPLTPMLQKLGIEPVLIDLHNTDTLRDALRTARTVFSSANTEGAIKLDMLPAHPITLIDASFKVVDGKPMGDLDPKIFNSKRRDIRATRPTHAVGPLTIRMLMRNHLAAAKARAMDSRERYSVPI
jgi:5,10-methylene-tetrahydrofolate dehydrogenase/methenyl tetrahydrofolate cyclohydrolase